MLPKKLIKQTAFVFFEISFSNFDGSIEPFSGLISQSLIFKPIAAKAFITEKTP